MRRHLGEFPIPFSVVIAVMLVAMGSVIGAISPWAPVRHLGWAAALIGLAALFIGLTRILWLALTENRMQFMSCVARRMIDEATTTDDLDSEWKALNERG